MFAASEQQSFIITYHLLIVPFILHNAFDNALRWLSMCADASIAAVNDLGGIFIDASVTDKDTKSTF